MSYTALVSIATTKKKRSFDAAFKLRVEEYAEQYTNRGTGRKFSVDEKNCSRSRIVAALEYWPPPTTG